MKLKFTLFLLLFGLVISAQEGKKTYSFSLQEAINHAIEYNYSSINSGRDIEAAKKRKWETTAAGLPQINAFVDYQNNFVLQKSVLPAEIVGGNPGEFVELAFGTKQNMNSRATLSQLIFDGSYIVALQASKTYLEFFENSKRKTDIDVKEMIINSYGNVLLAEETIAILEKNKSSLDKTLFETTQTYENGLAEEESVEQLKINLSAIVSNLNYSKRLKDIAYKMLKINLGIEIEDEITLTDKLESLSISNLDLAITNTEFSAEDNINYSLKSNFVEQRNLELKLERSKYLPSLGANVNFGYNAFSNEFTFVNQDQKWLNYSNVGLNLNIPIFSSFARSARTQQAKIALEKAKTELTEVEQTLKLEYQSAKNKFEFDVEQYMTTKENLRLSERIERKQQIKFTEGLSTSFEFTEAQRQLYTSQQDYLQAMVNIINSRAALEKITTK
ncbi:TolC family protein [Flavobacterium sp.]|uniref:TolC family protein n=1 Tax=Flavobacterium sp. TaxID=239 RepID=UPI00260CC168|nr:TolC family protein [Flavobacterium sp.]MDD2985468.1 TolC family protein [Flavobacterium sp.]